MRPNSSETGFKTLNIVFHGTFAFWVQNDGVDVLIPDVKMHDYYAGTWKKGDGLKRLVKGTTYKLNLPPQPARGIRFGDVANRSTNVFVAGSPNTTGKLFCTIQLRPQPNDIQTLQRITLERANFQNIPRGALVPERELGLIHVFTYQLGGAVPPIEGLKWTPAAGKDPSIVNLHVFADPPTRMSRGAALKHVTAAFEDAMTLAPGTGDFKFQYPTNEIALVEPNKDVPPGLRKIELVSLAASNLLTDAQMKASSTMQSMSKDDMGCIAGHVCTGYVICSTPPC